MAEITYSDGVFLYKQDDNYYCMDNDTYEQIFFTTKQIQKYIEGEFTDQIKKMTKTEGRILIKLIHRQTGKTVFNNIKGLRSGLKAFWYNTTANVFRLSLKDEYHPKTTNEDFLIEDILQRAFQDDLLKKQKSKLNFDFTKIIASKRARIDVEIYKQMFAKIQAGQNEDMPVVIKADVQGSVEALTGTLEKIEAV